MLSAVRGAVSWTARVFALLVGSVLLTPIGGVACAVVAWILTWSFQDDNTPPQQEEQEPAARDDAEDPMMARQGPRRSRPRQNDINDNDLTEPFLTTHNVNVADDRGDHNGETDNNEQIADLEEGRVNDTAATIRNHSSEY